MKRHEVDRAGFEPASISLSNFSVFVCWGVAFSFVFVASWFRFFLIIFSPFCGSLFIAMSLS
jgi:hypothetical protein